MGDVIYLSKEDAFDMTTFNELRKMYRKRDPQKYRAAIDKNTERYSTRMKGLLGRN